MLARRRFMLGAAALATPAVIPGARADTYPSRVVRLVVPFPPGGAVDAAARIIANRLSEMWGRQMMIENRGGAGGNIAAQAVLNAEADGYTVFIASIGHAINQFIYPSIGYNPVTDFSPVTLMCVYPNIMAVPNSSPDHSVADFIARAKADPGKLTFGSPGHGAVPHLSAVLFTKAAGITMTLVPYRGAAPGIQDLIPGRIDSFFNNIAPMVPLSAQGQLRLLAVTTAQRSPMTPDVAAMSETLPGYDVTGWYALFVPAKTPKDIIQKMYTGVKAAVDDPTIRKRLEEQAMIVVGSTPDELGRFHKVELDKWGPLIKEAGIKSE